MRRIFERSSITQHSFASIAKDATGGGPLDLSSGEDQKVVTGILRGLMITCDSTSFDVHIGQKANFVVGDSNVIYTASNQNKKLVIDSLYRAWINSDTDVDGNVSRNSYLYLTIINKDAHDQTNTINVQMLNDIHKRFS